MNKYVYGIVRSEKRESFGKIGIDNNEVYTVQYSDVGAIVSDVTSKYEVKGEVAKIHENVLLKIMKTQAAIPMGFGIIAKNETEIENMLKRAQIKFKNTLEKIDQKLQINVKIVWDKSILASVLAESEQIQKLIEKSKENSDQSIRIELGRKVKSALDARKSEYVENIKTSLEQFSDEYEENKIADPDTILNSAFLVDKKRENEFYDKLNELEKKYEKKLVFLSVGPLPPYNFTMLRAIRLDSNAIEEARKNLGLNKEVSISEINSAYDGLTKKYHPDLHSGDALGEERFLVAKKSYDVLMKYCEHYLCPLEESNIKDTIMIEDRDR
jgi:DnaJ-domain-containing protein 1